MSDKPAMQGSQMCAVCNWTENKRCISCRTQELINEIRTVEVDLEAMRQNRDEWEERCLKAEARTDPKLEAGKALVRGVTKELEDRNITVEKATKILKDAALSDHGSPDGIVDFEKWWNDGGYKLKERVDPKAAFREAFEQWAALSPEKE